MLFNPLSLANITQIVENLLAHIATKLSDRGISIELTQSAKAFIAEVGFDPVFGARPLKRAMYEEIEDRLAELILEAKVQEGDKVVFDVKNSALSVEIIHRDLG